MKKSWQTNRQLKLQPRLGKYWCYGCDCFLVGVGGKCKVCGKKSNKRRLKK